MNRQTSIVRDAARRTSGDDRRRRGALRMEAIMALIIVAAAFTATAQLVQVTHRQQRRHDRRDIALLEASNHLERLLAADWDDAVGAPGDAPRTLPASSALATLLPEARVELLATIEETPALAKRFQVSIISQSDDGAQVTWASLTAWRYHEGVAQ